MSQQTPTLPAEVIDELSRITPGPAAGRRARSDARGDLARRLSLAAEAYERDRYAESLRMTRSLLSAAPSSLAVRELHGLSCYRLGKWEDAIKHLEIVVDSSSDPNQIPVLMDCYRAIGRPRRVEELWAELRRQSPDVDVLVEGRLVVASTRAHLGDLDGAIKLLVSAGAARGLRHPAERHLRQWYLLADLLESSGDLAGARQIFERVVRADPEVADAADRLEALGRPPRRRPRSGAGRAK
jgi:tetratricopeptide (TPR) repeat protein